MKINIYNKKADFLLCLSKWREKHGLRKYPWRYQNDPYKILVTEILLRRTKADAVNSIWDNFFKKYPSFNALANADIKELYKDIESLGLAKVRSKALKRIGGELTDKDIPEVEEKLISIPGIGIYSARMFLLMKKGKRQLIYDANFRRVYSRFFGLEIGENLRNDKNIVHISEIITPKANVKDFVFTILDFAALTCKPSKPTCEICCCNNKCEFYKRIKDG